MGIIAFIILGIVAGFLARAIMPGRQSMSVFATAAVGMVGSLLGGFVANLIGGYPLFQFHASGIIGSVIGALVVLALMGFAGRRSARV